MQTREVFAYIRRVSGCDPTSFKLYWSLLRDRFLDCEELFDYVQEYGRANVKAAIGMFQIGNDPDKEDFDWWDYEGIEEVAGHLHANNGESCWS